MTTTLSTLILRALQLQPLIARATVHRSATPLRRAYETAREAIEHTQGYDDYPGSVRGSQAARNGWYEADRSAELREEARREFAMGREE